MRKKVLVEMLFCAAILFLCAAIMPVGIANAEEYEVTFDMPSTCVIGTDLVIKGISTGGDTVDIAIGDTMVAVDIPIDENGRFVKKIPTGAGTILGLSGGYKIKAYVNGPKDRDGNPVEVNVGDRIPEGLGILDDGDTVVIMTAPTLSADQSTDFVVQGNTYSITGTAPGSDYVDIVIIGSKGSYGVGIDGGYGITVYRVSVSKTGYTFSKTITVDKDAEDGRYIAMVLSPAGDQLYGYAYSEEMKDLSIADIITSGIFDLKTQSEALDLLMSKTVDVPGSDDLSQLFSFIVGKETGEFVPPKTSLTAEQLTNVVAKGDAYRISGTCYGSDFAHAVIISPKGKEAVGIDGAKPGFVVYKLSLEDNHFSKRIPVAENVDSGRYIAMVLSPGRNDIYDGIGTDDLKGELEQIISEIHPGTQEQIRAAIQDVTTEAAGSDDLAQELEVKIECPYINLKDIEDVQIGDILEINGTTNRERGTKIMIKTYEGPMDLPMAIAEVEWPTPDEGVFTATIDTYEAVVGTYTIEADDGEGHTDIVSLNIVATLPTPTMTPTPKLTPKPTPTPTLLPTFTPMPPNVDEYKPKIYLDNDEKWELSGVYYYGPLYGYDEYAGKKCYCIEYWFKFNGDGDKAVDDWEPVYVFIDMDGNVLYCASTTHYMWDSKDTEADDFENKHVKVYFAKDYHTPIIDYDDAWGLRMRYGHSNDDPDVYFEECSYSISALAYMKYPHDTKNPFSQERGSIMDGEEIVTPTPEEKGIPGFEAVFAIVGLLAVSYILRRKTK